jgi:hypothetical protein
MAAPERERRIERLVGMRVFDREGRVVGRLEEMRAEKEGAHYVVTEWHIGPAALFERLSVRHFGMHRSGRVTGYIARWDQLDLEDPARLVLTCRRDELFVVKAQ